MTLKIESSTWKGFTVLTLTGNIETEHIAELKQLFELQTDHRTIILDLQEIRLVDREAVRFLVRCETEGIKLKNCPTYIREWMGTEKD